MSTLAKSREEVINDQQYEFYMLPATEAYEIALEIGKIMAPIMMGAQGAERTASIDSALAALSPREMVALTKRILPSVHANGIGALEGARFDSHFTGRMGSLPAVLKVAMEHNFADFFTGLVAQFQQATKA